MTECTLHNLLTSCQYPQVFWIYQMNDYDENILLTKGTKQEMLEDDESSFDLIDHINDVVEYWTIREDGAMFVRIRMDDRAKELFSEDYVKKWDRFNPLKRPYLYTAELDDFTNCIYGSSEYLHPYGDPLDCHHFDTDDRKTENSSEKPNNCKYAENPSGDVWECGCFLDTYCEHQIYDRNPDGTINIVKCGYEPKTEPFDKDINVRSKTEPRLSEIPTSKCHYEPKTEPQTDCPWK